MAEVTQPVKASNRQQRKGEIPPRLRHRSRCSESENGTTELSGTQSSTPVPQADEEPRGREGDLGSESNGGRTSARSQTDNSHAENARKCSKPARKPCEWNTADAVYTESSVLVLYWS